MRRVACCVLSAAALSCAPSPPAPPPTAMRVPEPARVAPRRAIAPFVPVDVRVSFFSADGAYDGPFHEPHPDAASLVRPCFERAREADGALAGFVLFDVVVTSTDPARITTREASGLPPSLVACAATALAALRAHDSFFSPPVTAYVSVR